MMRRGRWSAWPVAVLLCLAATTVTIVAATSDSEEDLAKYLPVARCRACEDLVSHVLAAARDDASGAGQAVPTAHPCVKRSRSKEQAAAATRAVRVTEVMETACVDSVAASTQQHPQAAGLMRKYCDEALGELDDAITAAATGDPEEAIAMASRDAAKAARKDAKKKKSKKETQPAATKSVVDRHGEALAELRQLAAGDRAARDKVVTSALCRAACPVQSEMADQVTDLQAQMHQQALASHSVVADVAQIFGEHGTAIGVSFVVTVATFVLVGRKLLGGAQQRETDRFRRMRNEGRRQ